MGGSAPKYPKPSEQELELLKAQREALENQGAYMKQYYDFLLKSYEEQQRLQDLMYEQMGIEKVLDDQGKVIGYKYSEEATAEQQRYREFMQRQMDTADEQLQISRVMQEFALDQQGYRFVRDGAGKITGVEKRELTPEEQEEEELRTVTRQKQLKALKGEADLDPSLERDLAESKAVLEERLRRELGPDYATSDPGQRALAEFEQGKASTLWAARHGEAQFAGNMSSQLKQEAQRENALDWEHLFQTGEAPLASISSYGQASPMAYASRVGGVRSITAPSMAGFGQGSPDYGGMINYWGNQRANEYASTYRRYQQRAGFYGALIGSFLGAAGSYFGGQQGAQAGQQVGGSLGYMIA